VLRGIDAAAALGFPIKINCVIQRGVNDQEIPALAAFRERGHTLRFIEFMDVGTPTIDAERWCRREIVDGSARSGRSSRWGLLPRRSRGAISLPRWRGEVGLISSVTEPFCRDCHRARLSADGKLYTCLFASLGWDVLACLRTARTMPGWLASSNASAGPDGPLQRRAGEVSVGRRPPKVEMSYIGGVGRVLGRAAVARRGAQRAPARLAPSLRFGLKPSRAAALRHRTVPPCLGRLEPSLPIPGRSGG